MVDAMNKKPTPKYVWQMLFFGALILSWSGLGCSRSEPPAVIDHGPVVHVITDAEFNQQVLASPVPVLVDFWASWCPPCRMMNPILAEIATEQAETLRIVKVNTDDARALAERFNIRALPTLLLYRNGQAVAMQEGAMYKDALLQWIETQLATADVTTSTPAP